MQIITRPRFSPHCEPVALDPLRVVIITELEHYFVTDDLTRSLVGLIDGRRTTEEIVAELGDRFPAATLYYQLIQLAKKGLIEEAGEPSGDSPAARAFWHMLRLNHAGAGRHSLRLGLVCLGDAEAGPLTAELGCNGWNLEPTTHWQNQKAEARDLWLVITSDYLEPELAEFNAWALESGARWLLVKPCGIQSYVGPLFIPGRTGCWECLAHRQRLHREVELLYVEQAGLGRTLRLSRAALHSSLALAAQSLGLELAKLQAGMQPSALEGAVLSLDHRNQQTLWHRLVRRPQCPACGDPAPRRLPENLQELPPLELRPLKKSPLAEGGNRFRPPEETLADWQDLVSPVTGVLPYVKPNPCDPSFLGYHYGTVISKKDCINPNEEGRAYPVGASAGKGYTMSQAKVSTIGEAIERYCGRYQGREPLLKANYHQVAGEAVHPYDLLNFSEEQYRRREEWNQRGSLLAFVPEPYQDHTEIAWTPAYSLTHHRWRLVPACYVWFGFPDEGGHRYARANSNGLSAGSRLEEAILQGLLELVERDAVALWWLNRLRKPALDLDSFPSNLVEPARRGFAAKRRDLHLLDLTSDLGIPVFCAVAVPSDDPVQRHTRFGLGCDFDPGVALQRALGELGQIWASPNTDLVGMALRQLIKVPWEEKQHILPDPVAPPRRLDDFPREKRDDILADIETIKQRLAAMDMEVLICDLSHPDIKVKVVRVMVPGLRHMWPRFGPGRLYDLPVAMGWLERPRQEGELFQVPFDY